MLSTLQESIEKSMVRHPWRWGIVSFIVIGLPQWLSGTWALWSVEPLVTVLGKNLNMSEIVFSSSWITVPIGLFMFGYLAYALRLRTRHGKLADNIQIYERNTYNWDYTGDPNTSTLITSNTVLRKPVNTTGGFALLTPLIGNDGKSTVAINATFVVAIHFTQGTDFEYGPHQVWRAMDNKQVNRQRFIAELDEPVRPGRIKKGPDEMIRAKLPVGKYQVDIIVEGLLENGEKFLVERSCHIEIYG